MTVPVSLTSCLPYAAGVSPPSPFFGRSSLYSRRHVSITAWAWARLVNQCSLRHSSRKRPLKDSTYAFCVGLPGVISQKREAALVRPGEHGAPTELGAVVGAQDLREPPSCCELLQHARDGTAPERPRGHNRDGLS